MFSRITLLFFAAILAGCASTPQVHVPLALNTFSPESNRIGVVMTKLPTVDTIFPGASCLLCYAAASIANSQLTTYAKTLPHEDLPELYVEAGEALKNKGANVSMIGELDLKSLPDFSAKEGNFAKKDFSALKSKYHIDKLLVIDISDINFERNYAAYIPTSPPKAKLRGASYIVNLNNNAYQWYQPLDIEKGAGANWDEPPKYPGLTNAYFSVLELTHDRVLSDLIRSN